MEAFLDQLNEVVLTLTDFLSGKLLVVLLVGTGLWFTIRLGGVQFTQFGRAFKSVFGNINLNGGKAGKDGMTSFQSLATAIAAQVGTGNLAGAATAMVMGGPGAIFWMWVSAIFGMATIFVEASLAQKFKTTDETGEVTGGPVYYIRAAYKGTLGKVLAGAFAIFIILALGFFGNMVQSNSIGDAFKGAFGINPLGGIGRIASVTEKLVPIMAAFYIIGALVLIIMNIGQLPNVFRMIFVGAFNPEAAIGGFAGVAVSQAIKYGVARGLFSNEAGMGSTPHAHAVAKVDHPVEQGFVAMIGVFIDTFIVLNLTAFVIITTKSIPSGKTGAELSQYAFSTLYGKGGDIFIAICMFFFAFSTIIGWYFFGQANIKYLFGPKAVKVYSVLVAVCVVLGSLAQVDLVWNMADCFNSMMVIPNFIGLIVLSGTIKKLHDDYYQNFKKNK